MIGFILANTSMRRLVNEENLNEVFAEQFNELKQADLKVSRAWAIKELLRGFWNHRYAGWAKRHFDKWYAWAIRSRLEGVFMPHNQTGKTILIYGPPLSGKSSLCDLLESKNNFIAFGFGKYLRQMSKAHSTNPQSIYIQDVISKGDLLCDEVAYEIFKQEAKFSPIEDVVIDGFPRTASSIESFRKFMRENHRDESKTLVIVIHLETSKAEIEKKAKLRARQDDVDIDILARRICAYRNNVEVLLEHLSNHYSIYKLTNYSSLDKNYHEIVNQIRNIREL